MANRRIGIVGYGHLGRYLVEEILKHEELELAFIWNRSLGALDHITDRSLICQDLEKVGEYSPDLIVEVAHPDISEEHGETFLSVCDYLIGSPTAMARISVDKKLRCASKTHALYIPAGALWGGTDIAKMADQGTLKELEITMTKHPSCFKLRGYLKDKYKEIPTTSVVLYEGPVRELCELAPNNVNTMAAASIAAYNLGFDKVIGRLVADPSLTEWHIVVVEATGPTVNGNVFSVKTVRRNPANPGVVTGTATYGSFLASLLNAKGRGPGIHLC